MKTLSESKKNDISAISLFSITTSLPIGAFHTPDVLHTLMSSKLQKQEQPLPQIQDSIHGICGVNKSEQCVFLTFDEIDVIY